MSLPFVGPKYKSGVWTCQHISSPQLPAIAQIPLPSRLSSSPRPATCLRNVRTTCPKSSSLVESAPQRRQTYQRVHQWSQQAEAEAVLPQPHQATKRSWEVWDGYSVRIHVAVTLTSTMRWHACSRAAGSFFSKHAPRTTCRCCRMRGTRAQCRMHPCRCCSLVCCRVFFPLPAPGKDHALCRCEGIAPGKQLQRQEDCGLSTTTAGGYRCLCGAAFTRDRAEACADCFLQHGRATLDRLVREAVPPLSEPGLGGRWLAEGEKCEACGSTAGGCLWRRWSSTYCVLRRSFLIPRRMGPSGTCTQWLPGSGCKETLCEPTWHLHHEKARFFFASHPATLACAWLCCFSLLVALVQVHLHSTNSEASDTERKNDGQTRTTAPWISETHPGIPTNRATDVRR